MKTRSIRSLDVPASGVRDALGKRILVDGLQLVFDYDRSHGSYLVDRTTGREFLDFFCFFASQPVGYNHPLMHDDAFSRRLLKVARCKPSSSDVYTEEYASFIETLGQVGMRGEHRYAFLIAGGALAVENALKAAFDWKVRKNLARGRGERGHKVIHFRDAFHGRSGYTLSLTNTDPKKYMYFPKFDWPRIDTPGIEYPRTDASEARVREQERLAVSQIERAFEQSPDDIAAIIIEPMLSEGGDIHVRAEFLRELRRLADEREALLIFDEVQTGGGASGTFWAWEQLGVRPDLLAFGKKLQVCGVLSTERVDDVPDNVFRVASRINSTWGADVVDMVRSQRYLEIIQAERLLDNVKARGEELLAGLEDLCARHPVLTAARGRGLLCALDVDTPERRDRMIKIAFDKSLLLLGCGKRSIRTRPFLDVTAEDIARFLEVLDAVTAEATK